MGVLPLRVIMQVLTSNGHSGTSILILVPVIHPEPLLVQADPWAAKVEQGDVLLLHHLPTNAVRRVVPALVLIPVVLVLRKT